MFSLYFVAFLWFLAHFLAPLYGLILLSKCCFCYFVVVVVIVVVASDTTDDDAATALTIFLPFKIFVSSVVKKEMVWVEGSTTHHSIQT